MADKPLPDDRAMLGVLEKLKSYNNYKARQSQQPVAGPARQPIDGDLKTVETWAADAADDGQAWGQNKQQESDAKVREGDAWDQQLQRDDKEAAAEADFRDKLDPGKIKEELKGKLDDHVAAIKGLADGGEPGFKGKLVKTKQEAAEAKKYLDDNLEKSIEDAAKRNAQQREDRKAIGEAMKKRGEEGKAWKSEYGNQPDKFPEGQRTDVEAALDRIASTAAGLAGELQPFGARAAPHVQSLNKVQQWATDLKPRVAAQGPALKTAKAGGQAGAADARATFARVESFQSSLESEGGENLDLFRRWTDQNNRLAKTLSTSNNPKHQKWAADWMKTQEH
jgi:hypothetical protein